MMAEYGFTMRPNVTATMTFVPVSSKDTDCANVYWFHRYSGPSVSKTAIILIHGFQPLYSCGGPLKDFTTYDPESLWIPMAGALQTAFPSTPVYIVRYPTTL